MGQESARRRLDEILIEEGLISEEEIKEALMRQKAQGGKFGSQLLYYRYVDEEALVHALSKQFDCEGVILSRMEIPEILTKMVPRKVVLARKVMPFDYDPEHNVLKIACPDPTDQDLINELNFVARGKDIKLYVAAELAITTAIARHYLGREITLEESLLLEIPDYATDTGRVPIVNDLNDTGPVEDIRPAILMVTDEAYAAPLMQSLFERDNFKVVITDSADEAIDLLGQQIFHTVFIKDTVPGDYIDLIDRVRKISSRTTVRYYDSAASLLLNIDSLNEVTDLSVMNLELFSSLLASTAKLPRNHSGRVGKYVDRLCRKLGLPDKERMLISNAAYIHDLARFYYDIDENEDNQQIIRHTVKLLSSLNYPPVVVEMLRSTYKDLKHKFTKRLPIESLGGNIITIVDLFCESIPDSERLSLDKFDAVKRKLRDMVGKLFLAEVVEVFIAMIQEEILTCDTSEKIPQIMIFSHELTVLQRLELRLKNEGFRVLSHNAVDVFVDLYQRGKPDILILVMPGDPDTVKASIAELRDGGIDFEQVPALLLTAPPEISRLSELLENGIEDIIALDESFDMLVSKLRKIKSRLGAVDTNAGSSENVSGAHGRLSDMSLIDLLQALGPSRKTVKMTVQFGDTDDSVMVLYLNLGQITYAELDNFTGAEAVYEGLGWADGTWTVEPIDPDDIPEPNNELSNESILMEGCRLLDEKIRGGQLL